MEAYPDWIPTIPNPMFVETCWQCGRHDCVCETCPYCGGVIGEHNVVLTDGDDCYDCPECTVRDKE